MSDWQRTLVLQPEWSQSKAKEITVAQLAGVIAERLKALPEFGGRFIDIDERKETLVYEFEGMSKDKNLDPDEFDGWMDELYDWGDIPLDGRFGGKKVCFVDWMNKAVA